MVLLHSDDVHSQHPVYHTPLCAPGICCCSSAQHSDSAQFDHMFLTSAGSNTKSSTPDSENIFFLNKRKQNSKNFYINSSKCTDKSPNKNICVFLFYIVSTCNSLNTTLFIPVKETVHSSSPPRFNQLITKLRQSERRLRTHQSEETDKGTHHIMGTQTADKGIRVRFRLPKAQIQTTWLWSNLNPVC